MADRADEHGCALRPHPGRPAGDSGRAEADSGPTAAQADMKIPAAKSHFAALRTAFTDVMGDPAWRHLPIWYLIATRDQAIPPDAQRPFARRMDAITPQRGHSSLTVGRAHWPFGRVRVRWCTPSSLYG
jgi:hypothetical protein